MSFIWSNINAGTRTYYLEIQKGTKNLNVPSALSCDIYSAFKFTADVFPF